jgi:hypothetical protein
MKKMLLACLLVAGCEIYGPHYDPYYDPVPACSYTAPYYVEDAYFCNDMCCTWEIYTYLDGYSVTCQETWCCHEYDCVWELQDIDCYY